MGIKETCPSEWPSSQAETHVCVHWGAENQQHEARGCCDAEATDLGMLATTLLPAHLQLYF